MNYLRKTLLHEYYEAGKITPGKRLEEIEMPDAWMTVYYNWDYVNDEDYKRDQKNDEDRFSLSEPRDEAEGGKRKDDMVWMTLENAIDYPEGAVPSTWRHLAF